MKIVLLSTLLWRDPYASTSNVPEHHNSLAEVETTHSVSTHAVLRNMTATGGVQPCDNRPTSSFVRVELACTR
jgi:hypothetical protein